VAILKPSELSAASSKLIASLIPRYLDTGAVAVVEGAIAETQFLLQQKWDFIFYTGNGIVGRVVARAAAEHLTPTVLELGGKCPVYVDKNCNLAVAAKRIVNGKYFNAGQTCVGVDYVLAHREIEAQLIELIKEVTKAFFGSDPKNSDSLSRIISERHVTRLARMLSDTTGIEVLEGGQVDVAARYVAPTLLKVTSPAAACMQEEIFGPILPVLTVDGPDQAIALINSMPTPLALYVYSNDRIVVEKMLAETNSGGAAINECTHQATVPDLPFGGCGESGMGAYHGRAGFEALSHHRGVLDKTAMALLDLDVRYPPYTDAKLGWLKRLA